MGLTWALGLHSPEADRPSPVPLPKRRGQIEGMTDFE
jgi:hypothetical protein